MSHPIDGNRLHHEAQLKLIRLNEDILKELVGSFRDTSELNEQLHKTSKELDLIRQKLKLLD